MKWMKRRKHVRIASSIALITAVVMIITYFGGRELIDGMGGSFGGTVHYDFGDTNTDIYVENWSNVPVYARVRLYEYMEIGPGAGNTDPELNQSTPLISGSNANDLSTWSIHASSGNLDSDVFSTYWQWNTGGQKYYFPVAKELRGAVVDGIDYIDSNSPANMGPFDVSENGTHTRLTPNSTVFSMADWLANDRPIGDIWVIDSDGWAYWASPILPNDSTGLFLNSLVLLQDPGQEYFYNIYVEAQLTTRDGSLTEDGSDSYTTYGLPEMGGWTAEAQSMMDYVTHNSNPLGYVSITSDMATVEDVIYVPPGQIVTLTAYNSDGSPDISWSHSNASSFSISASGNVAYIALSENAANDDILTVTAESLTQPGIATTRAIAVLKEDTIPTYNATINQDNAIASQDNTFVSTDTIVANQGIASTAPLDPNYYDNGDNTFCIFDVNDTLVEIFSGGIDEIPGTADDTYSIIIYGSEMFQGPDLDGSYWAKGTDGKLGTVDDISVQLDIPQDALVTSTDPTNSAATTPTADQASTTYPYGYDTTQLSTTYPYGYDATQLSTTYPYGYDATQLSTAYPYGYDTTQLSTAYPYGYDATQASTA
ncbi:MAG: hypothetical protein LBQ68_10575, partial [Clostridiales bacterium]|nr:hypothetical protein [Clostridiales bacterium]